MVRRGFAAGITCILIILSIALAASAQSSLSEGYAAGDVKYTPSERAGREIWFFATAFNDRFFTYTYPQRLGGGDRLVPHSRRQIQRRPLPGLGRDPRPRLLHARRSRLPGAVARRDLRLPLVPGRR